MKHTYHIQGMTCNGCKNTVKKALSNISNVTEVSVNLENKEATITMDGHIQTPDLQNALPDKYTISDTQESKSAAIDFGNSSDQKSKLQQLKPLFFILGYILVASIFLHRDSFDISAMMLDFMGLFYIVFSFFKLLDVKGFSESFKMYDPLAKVVPPYGFVYPFIEVMLGLMFLMRFEINIALVATIVVLGITTFGVTKTLLDKKSIQCACLGTTLDLPMTEATFIENAIMIVMAVLMLGNLV